MALPAPKPPQQIHIELPPDLQAAYANLARIAHAPGEFVLDFARILPGDVKAPVTARVIMSPMGVKLFSQALAENIARYEAMFGQIKVPSGGPTLADTLFKTIQPPEPPNDK